MKDIKSLYLTAKTSGKTNDVSAYTEAINELLESNPNGYISNLEYIIKSDIGLKTFGTFIEKYGLPIACYDMVMEQLNECVRKSEVMGKDSSLYKEAVNSLIDFRTKYAGCFMMESYFHDKLPENYVSTYYSINENGVQNRKLIAGLIKEYGEAAIPDIIITADSLGEKSLNTALSYIEKCDISMDPVICEWVIQSISPLNIDIDHIAPKFESGSLSNIISSMRSRNNKLYKESVMLGNSNVQYEYTEDELYAINSLIPILEYKLTWCDELNESVKECQDLIYSLYEEFDGLLTPDGTVENFNEAKWIVNTRNKKTGEVPSYLGNNHDLKYGEDDDINHETPGSSSIPSILEPEPDLGDFKRPSAEDISGSSAYSGLDNKDDGNETHSSSETHAGGTNNYYYYTYNNSLNKNSHSFNRDHSHIDDHSTNKGDNRTDNRDYSRNINQDKTKPSDDTKTESSDQEGDLDSSFNEAVGDADDGRPESDHPIKDTLQDIDKELTKHQQKAKKKVQDIQNVGRAFMKPAKRTEQWISNMVYNWKDADETRIKEKMADPHARSNLFTAIKKAIVGGSLLKAGLLLNPVFLFLSVTKRAGKNKREFRIRNEMIGELKTELSIIDEKIKDADRLGDTKAKYRLMRLKNEINKKLLRVGGDKQWKKFI